MSGPKATLRTSRQTEWHHRRIIPSLFIFAIKREHARRDLFDQHLTQNYYFDKLGM